jgi:hypothetical protein
LKITTSHPKNEIEVKEEQVISGPPPEGEIKITGFRGNMPCYNTRYPAYNYQSASLNID